MGQSIDRLHAARLELYRKKGAIHARAVSGRFNTWRWIMVWITQAVFYGGCWLEWNANGTARQAILFDIAHEKLYFFGLVLWPQDALLLALLLVFAAIALFLATALAGRVFCGFACPQTVYTAVFTWIEARVEGDHLARLRLDQAPASGRKLALKSVKHGLWLLLAVWTGITFVGYFTPVRELLPALLAGSAGPWEGFWLVFYSAFLYVQAGLAREAVCQHMCPYARFQGVMVDQATRNAGYDRQRGEPRHVRRQAGEQGSCIDCGICVQACPVGIDIRDGLQYPCINCGLCIDACDGVMKKTGEPVGLIRFMPASEASRQGAQASVLRRPRVVTYACLLLLVAAAGGWMLQTRTPVRIDVLRDRGELYRESASGHIENTYTLKVANLDDVPRRFSLQVSGLPGLEIIGPEQVWLAPGNVVPLPVTVSVPADSEASGIRPVVFRIVAGHDPAVSAQAASRFVLP